MGNSTLSPNQIKINGAYTPEELKQSKVFALVTKSGEQGYLIDITGKFEQYVNSDIN